MTLSVLEGHSPIASLFKCNISFLWCVARSLCICGASYVLRPVIAHWACELKRGFHMQSLQMFLKNFVTILTFCYVNVFHSYVLMYR